ncbi:hypothetical protein KUF71_012309, partial [Frankliniella fusca]
MIFFSQMSFFEMYNSVVAPLKPSYRRNTELPLFVPMKIMDFKPAVTAIGPTHQVNCILNDQEIYFYLNAADHAKVLEFNGVAAVMGDVQRQQHPFAICVRKRSGLGTLILPSSSQLIEQSAKKAMIKKTQIPPALLSEFDFEGMGLTC